MKLWIQSGGTLGTDPSRSHYKQSLEGHLCKVARPDTEIELHGTKVFTNAINIHRYARYLHTAQMIDCAVQAEREGYDAFAALCTLDMGYYEMREAVEIPVVFPIETALHVAALLAPKIGFLVMNPAFLEHLTERAKLYGFQDRITPGGCVNLTAADLHLGFKNPKPVIEQLTAEAKKIGEQGANILILAGNPLTLLLVEQGITELGGIRVLDSLGALVKVTELMVDLNKIGINRNKMGLYSPLPKGELGSLRELYGVE